MNDDKLEAVLQILQRQYEGTEFSAWRDTIPSESGTPVIIVSRRNGDGSTATAPILAVTEFEVARYGSLAPNDIAGRIMSNVASIKASGALGEASPPPTAGDLFTDAIKKKEQATADQGSAADPTGADAAPPLGDTPATPVADAEAPDGEQAP